MNKKSIVWALIFAILIAAAIAVPPNPEVYWGYVYVEGDKAEAGNILTVQGPTGELLGNQTLPVDISKTGSYAINIIFDDPITPADEGAAEGDVLTWKLNGVIVSSPAPGTDTAQSGKTNNNFRIDAYINPSISMAVSYSSQTITISQNINLTINLTNTGAGSGNATIDEISGFSTALPITLDVPKNSSNSTTVTITPASCSAFTPNLTASYYNRGGSLVDILSEQLNFTVTGPDILLSSLQVSDYAPAASDTISISVIVSNIGEKEINGFTIKFYDQLTGGNLINNITSTVNLSSGENTTIQFNKQFAQGTYRIKAIANISNTECSASNNEINSSTITVSAASQTGQTTGGGGGSSTRIITTNETQECLEHKIKLTKDGTIVEIQEDCDLVIFEYKGKEYNITLTDTDETSAKLSIKSTGLSSVVILQTDEIKELDLANDDSYEVSISLVELAEKPRIKFSLATTAEEEQIIEEQQEMQKLKLRSKITGWMTQEIGDTNISIFHLIILAVIITIVMLYSRKGGITLTQFIPKQPPQQEEKSDYIKTMTRAPKEPIKENVLFGILSGTRPRQATQIPRQRPSIIINKPEEQKPEKQYEYQKELKPRSVNITIKKESKIPLFFNEFKKTLNTLKPVKKIPKTDPGLSEEEKKLPQVPYEYLSEAIELMEKIRKNLKPRDDLIKEYSSKYPKFLIDLVAKNIFINSSFKGNIDVVHELERLKVLDKEYKYISINKLAKAIDIIAKGHASKDNKKQ